MPIWSGDYQRNHITLSNKCKFFITVLNYYLQNNIWNFFNLALVHESNRINQRIYLIYWLFLFILGTKNWWVKIPHIPTKCISYLKEIWYSISYRFKTWFNYWFIPFVYMSYTPCRLTLFKTPWCLMQNYKFFMLENKLNLYL